MAVDTLFGSVHVLIQGASTANAALPAATPGYESLPWLVTPTVSGVTAGADHSVFSSAGRISLAQSGYPNKTWGPVLDIELVIEQAWDTFGKLLENGTIKIEADTDTPNRYVLHWNAFYLYPNAPPYWEAKGGFFVPASGRFLLRVHGSAAANAVSVTVITEANASTTAVFSVGGFLGAYPLTIGTPGTASQINPPPSEASASAAGDPAGQYAYATPSRATFFATFNRSTTPASGSVTISGCGVSYVANAAGKTASALSSELASSFVSALSSAGYTASYGFNGTSYEITIQPKSASDPHYPYHSFSVSGSAVFAAAGEGWAANATVPLSTGGSLQQVALWGAPPGVVQTSRFTVFVADGAKDYLLSMTVAGVTATANLQNNVAGALANLAGQLGLGAWQQTTPGTYVNSRSYTNPGPVPDTASIVQNVVQPSAITKLYALRVTAAERTDATFPTLPWPTTSIPSSGGGGGNIPSSALYYYPFESGDAFPMGNSGSISSHTMMQVTGVNGGQLPSVAVAPGGGYAMRINGFETTIQNGGSNPAFTPITGDFTLECWVYRDESVGQFSSLFSIDGLWVGVYSSSGALYAYSPNIGISSFSSTLVLPYQAWAHISVVRTGGTLKGYLNGVLLEHDWPSFGGGDVGSNLAGPAIGADGVFSSYSMGGYYDDFIVTSAAKYTTSFTPAPRGQAFGSGGSGLILPSDVIFAVSADLGNVNDQSQYAAPATIVGSTVSVPTSGSRTGDGYIRNTNGNQYVDAVVRYATTPAQRAAWNAATAMTFEYDIRIDQLDFYGGQIIQLAGGSGNDFVSGNVGTGEIWLNLSTIGDGYTPMLTPGAWYHIAVVNEPHAGGGGTADVRTYVNGVLFYTSAGGADFQTLIANTGRPMLEEAALLQLSAQSANGSLNGGLDNIILTARAKYTSNFTPPTSFQAATGGIGGSGVTVVNFAGYNDLDGATGTGTFNTQATYPTAYFSANATLEGASASGDTFVVDGNTITFTGSRTLAAATNTGAFVSGTPVTFDGDATAEDALSNAAFYAGLPLEWSGDSVLEDASQLGIYLFLAPAEFSGGAVLDGVTPGLTLFNLIDPVVWRVNAEVPAATLVANATQFLVNAQVPAATLRASMSEYRGFELAAQVPAASLSAWTGLGVSGQVPMATLSASGTVVNTLRLDADLPRVTLAADASLGQLLSMSATVPAPTLSAWAGAGVAGIVPVATCAANVVSGGAFRVDATVPAATAAIGATSMNVLRLVGDVPAVARANWLAISRQVPAIGMLANIAPVSAITRVAYSFTLANSAMTRYPAYPFIQVIRMGNIFYGVAEDGLHEIGGTTDNAAPIPWAWETCLSDFGQAERKTVVSAYLGGYVPEAMTYTIRAGDVPTGTNSHATTATAVLRNHRQKFGIGRKSRYFAFGLSAAQGRVAIESIEFEVATMSRRI